MRAIVILIASISTPAMAQTDLLTRCLNELAERAELQSIRVKLPVLLTEQKFATLTIQDRPTAEELPAITVWAEGRERCHMRTAADRDKMHPMIASLWERGQTELMVSVADLYIGKITYGEFARNRKAIIANIQGQIDRVVDRGERDAQAQARDDYASRRAVLPLLMERTAPAPFQPTPAYQIPIPRTTNCSPNGLGGVRCTTR